MKVAVITRFGPPEVLQIQDWPTPVPGEEEVLIKVKAIGLNFADIMARLGVYPSIPEPPFVPGIEFTGVVVVVGKKVRTLRKGDRVWSFSKQGAYAEYVRVPSNFVQPLPKNMSFEVAAAIGVTYLTAYHALITLANIQKKQKVLIHAAAGGVGIAALQVAKHRGAQIFATVGSQAKKEVALANGADHVIDYSSEKFADVIRLKTDGYGVDVILDSVGGKVMKEGWKLLAPMGRYVLFGFASAIGARTLNRLKLVREALSIPIVFPTSMVSRNVGLFGFNLYFLADRSEYLGEAFGKIVKWYDQGIIRPVIGARYSFDQIVEAQTFLQSRKSIGKVIVTL